MDRTPWRAALLLAVVALLATPSASAFQRAGPCIGPGFPPRLGAGNCGPAFGVQVTLRVTSAEGTKEYTFGSCADECDLRVIIDVVVCRSRAAVGYGEAVVEGEMRIVDRHGALVDYRHQQMLLVQVALLPWCVEGDVP